MTEINFVDFSLLAVQLCAIAVLIETITEVVKTFLKGIKPKLSKQIIYYLSIVIGIIFTCAFNISLFDTKNALLFYVGAVLSGAIASRGANYIYDILKVLKNIKK